MSLMHKEPSVGLVTNRALQRVVRVSSR
eukprot:COSAG06_NODE_4721_length_4007_cov_8.144831_1_plen_27_part_10